MSDDPAARPQHEADDLARALELELAAKRAGWERGKAKRGLWRALSFAFLLLVILGALLAYFYFATEMRSKSEVRPAPATESR